MIELLLSVCFVDDPARCRDVRLNFLEESITPQQCMKMGQIEIAKWSEGHPNWRVKRWSCGPAGRVART